MSLHTARVIPEKRFSCPPAAVHFAGVEKEIDMKLTYAEQLRRPEWQKMRLLVLERAGWKCEQCGEEEKMLHVHHKRYIKGRMAWDYELDNFEALCESCHEENHQHRERIETVLASIPGYMWEQAADVLTFWAWEYLPEGTSFPVDPFEEAVDQLARTCRGKLGIHQVFSLIDIAVATSKSSGPLASGFKD
jgi:hypothetical protein